MMWGVINKELEGKKKIKLMKSYIENLEDNLAFVYDKEHVMKNRRKYFGENAEEYVSFCELKSEIKALREEKANLQVRCIRYKKRWEKSKEGMFRM